MLQALRYIAEVKLVNAEIVVCPMKVIVDFAGYHPVLNSLALCRSVVVPEFDLVIGCRGVVLVYS